MSERALKVVPDGDAAGGGLPLAPEHLGRAGRAWWDRRVREYSERGVLRAVDLDLLEQAAEMYDGRRIAQRAVREKGTTLKDHNHGGEKKNPAMGKQLEYAREFRLCVDRLNRSVAGAVPIDDDADPFDF